MVNRIEPNASPDAYKTYQIAAPVSTHWRQATCQEVQCENYLKGWQVRVEGLSEADLHLATHCGREYRTARLGDGETYLVYAPGQPCFRAPTHRVRVERDERFFVTGGDWRGNPRNERREHVNAADWQEDMADHLDRLHEAYERG